MSKNNLFKSPGVTLLLALLLLASILAISFSLTTIVFIEVRSSGDLLKTEGAFYAASGVGEQAFFNLSRKVSNPPPYVGTFANGVKLNGQPVIVTTNSPILLDKIVPGMDFDHTTNKYDFCNLNASAEGCGYGKVVLNYVSTGHDTDPLYAYLCEFSPTGAYATLPCTTPSTSITNQGYWRAPSGEYSGSQALDGSVPLNGGTVKTVAWTLIPGNQQELILTTCVTSCSTDSSNVYFSITTYASDGVTPQGLPYVGQTAVLVNTQSGAVSRKIQITVPNSGNPAP